MEYEGIADRYNEVHITALRYVYQPRINRALQEFREQWNNHPLRTEHNKSPNMLWFEGMLSNPHLAFDGPVELFDDRDPVPDLQTVNNVQVPELSLRISDGNLVQLQSLVQPMVDDKCRGILLFKEAVNYISRIVM